MIGRRQLEAWRTGARIAGSLVPKTARARRTILWADRDSHGISTKPQALTGSRIPMPRPSRSSYFARYLNNSRSDIRQWAFSLASPSSWRCRKAPEWHEVTRFARVVCARQGRAPPITGRHAVGRHYRHCKVLPSHNTEQG